MFNCCILETGSWIRMICHGSESGLSYFFYTVPESGKKFGSDLRLNHIKTDDLKLKSFSLRYIMFKNSPDATTNVIC